MRNRLLGGGQAPAGHGGRPDCFHTLKQQDLRHTDLTQCGHGLPLAAQAGSGDWASLPQSTPGRPWVARFVGPRDNRLSWELEAK